MCGKTCPTSEAHVSRRILTVINVAAVRSGRRHRGLTPSGGAMGSSIAPETSMHTDSQATRSEQNVLNLGTAQ